MNKNNTFITGSHHTFKSALLKGLLFLCLLPAPAKAQLFGGMIKTRPIIPPNITLGQNMTYFVASVYDEDYLPYNGPDGAASTLPKAAGVPNETLIINMQGTITTSGVTVVIPVTATGDGVLLAYSSTVTVPREKTEDDTSRELKFSWESQAYSSSTIFIKATIAAVDGPLNVKKLDISGGLGPDYSGIELGQLVYPYNSAATTTTTYTVRAIPGIPDKMFGKTDLGSTTTYQHNFLYCPVTGEDGKIWLNNNLGADYSNINKASFNPNQQAIERTDFHAYGSLFQWGRAPDGHELVTWSSTTSGTAKYLTTTTKSDNPPNALFIKGSGNWRVTSNSALWESATSTNNPCPAGYLVPAYAALLNYMEIGETINSLTSLNEVLRVTSSGYRMNTGPVLGSWGGMMWSGTSDGVSAYAVQGSLGTDYNLDDDVIAKIWGHAIRCIKN